jgi:hypothetical protein
MAVVRGSKSANKSGEEVIVGRLLDAYSPVGTTITEEVAREVNATGIRLLVK